MSEQKRKRTLKIVTSGDGGVGKTSFLNKLINDKFDQNQVMTRGIDFWKQLVSLKNISEIDLIFWDFAGQFKYRPLLENFMMGTSGAFFMFDLDKLHSIESIEKWINILRRFDNIPILLVGTKLDLKNGYNIDTINEYALSIKEKYGLIDYIVTSSLTGTNIRNACLRLLEDIFQSLDLSYSLEDIHFESNQ